MNDRYLRFTDEVIERKYYEDEYLRIIQTFKYQVYMSCLVSVVLIIMAFIGNDYTIILMSVVVVLFMPIIILYLAKRFQYRCNVLLSINNIAWCLLISAVYIWRSDSIMMQSALGQNGLGGTQLLVLGGGFYTLHLSLLIGTNFLLNVVTFTVINSIYILSVMPSIANLLCLLILAPLCVGATSFGREKNARLYYELINKYYIWYHIANNVLPQKIIITKTSTSARDSYQFVKANRRARKEFSVNSNEDLHQFISKIDLKQETHQSYPLFEDTINMGNMDSQHSKSIGGISQFSKRSINSRQSNARFIPLDLLMRREIRRQNSNELHGGDQHSSHNINNGQYNLDSNGAPLIQNNLNTTIQDQGALYMRNQRKSLFQMDDAGLHSIMNPSTKQKKVMKTRRSKQEKYKGIFKNDVEEKNKFLLTLICYSRDEQYQLIMIEEDTNMQREQILSEQIALYKNFSISFANIMQSESNLLQFYLQQIRQNNQIQKKITNFIYDAFYLNTGVTSRINNFVEFFNIENNKIEIYPKQFSVKKLIKEITSSVDFRLKQNQIQLIISNDCSPEQDIIQNDEKRLRHLIYHLLFDCIQNTQKGQIIISTSPGTTEIGDDGNSALTGTIKIVIRDNSSRKYLAQRNSDFFFATSDINKIIKNKTQSYQDIEVAVCKQLLKLIGPQGSFFYMSEEKNNTNRASFYIYTDILQEGGHLNMSQAKERIMADEEGQMDDEDEAGVQFQAQIQNSDDDEEDEDTYKDNKQQSPVQDAVPDLMNNPFQSTNQNPSSIYIYHGVDSRQNGQQGSALQFSSQYQVQLQQQGQNANSQEKHLTTQQHQGGQPSSQLQAGGQSSSNPMSAIQILQQSQSLYSQSQSNSQVDRNINNHLASQLERREQDNYKSSISKSNHQLFEETDKIDDENPVSEVYIKELSQTSVKFKRDLSRRLSNIAIIFKNTNEELEYNTRINSMQRVNSNNPLTQLNKTSTSLSRSVANPL